MNLQELLRMSKPARLHKCANYDMKQQLEIRVQTVLLLLILVIMFFGFCFIIKGPTYGVL